MPKRFVTRRVTEVCVDYKPNGEEIWRVLWGIYDKRKDAFIITKGRNGMMDEHFYSVDRNELVKLTNEIENMSNEQFNEEFTYDE